MNPESFDGQMSQCIAELKAVDAILTACDPRADHDLLRDLAKRRIELQEALEPFGVIVPVLEKVE
jgi:hypothetical protein